RPRRRHARARRAGRLPPAAREGPRPPDPPADRTRCRARPGRGARRRRRRLPREAVRGGGAARPDPGAPATGSRARRGARVRRPRPRPPLAFGAARRTRPRSQRARSRSPRAPAPQPATGRHARRSARAGLAGAIGGEPQRRRPLRLVPPPQARHAASDRDRARRRVRPRPVSGRSLQLRAVVASALAILLALVVGGAVVDVLVARHLHRSLDRTLRQRAVAIAQLSASAPALLTTPGALDSPVGATQLSVEVLDRHGRIVARSLALGGRVLPTGPLVRSAIADGRGGYADARLGGDEVRVYAAPLADLGGPAAGGAVVVASSTHDLHETPASLHPF